MGTYYNQPFNILVIEDDPMHSKLLCLLLEKEGFQPIACGSGEEAMSACASHEVRVAILDLVLPDMDGVSVLSRIKASYPEIKVIINTAHGSLESAMAAVNREAFAYVQKGGDEKELINHIHRAVKAHYEDYGRRLEEETRTALSRLRSKVAETESLYNGTKAILEDADFNTTARRLFDICSKLIGGAAGYVAMLSEDGSENKLLFLESGGLSCDVSPDLPMPVRGLRQEACKSGTTVYENDFSRSEWMKYMPEGHVRLENVLFAPIRIDSKTAGLMGIANKPGGFTDYDARIAQTFGELAAISLRNTLSQENIREKERRLRQTQKLEALGALAGGIAHDFNNILFPIVGFSEMIREDLPVGDPLHEYVDEILTATERARDLINQILSFSRQAEKEITHIKPQFIVKEIMKLIRSTLPATIDIRRDIDPDCKSILADPTHIHQIVMNLATNAYHAMEDSGGVLSVRLQNILIDKDSEFKEKLKPGSYVCLTVSDTGEGMSPRTVEKAFDPYFTTRTGDKGTGLGLSIVHGIVKSYSGDIFVNSAIGEGAEFKVFIPAVESRRELMEEKEIVEIQTGNERVLLVDDEEPIVRLEKQVVEKLGYRVATCTSGVDALEVFKKRPDAFDVVLTDMTMPNMTGETLTREILKIRPNTPVIICTGFSDKISLQKAREIGAKGYLLKPVVRSELALALRKALSGE